MTTRAKRIVIFGAGSTGRGHIGQLAAASGYHLVFIDKDPTLVQELAAAQAYTVRLFGAAATRDVVVRNYTAYGLGEEQAIAAEIVACDLVLTAVLAENLPGVAKPLAKALQQRADQGIERPLNVIACENMINASAALCEHVYRAIAPPYHDYLRTHVGFPNAMISRVVPAPKESRLFLEAEDYNEWPVEKAAYLGSDPGIEGLCLVDNLSALLERKLFMHNTGHAVCGYLAHCKGYTVMCDAIVDPRIQEVVRGAMTESGEALIRKHGFSRESILRYRDDFIPRVAGRAILDPVARVIRSPLRKIGRHERLVGPACMASDYGIEPQNLALGIAALLSYRAADDPEAALLRGALDEHGLRYVLTQFAGIEARYTDTLLELTQAALTRLPTLLGGNAR